MLVMEPKLAFFQVQIKVRLLTPRSFARRLLA